MSRLEHLEESTTSKGDAFFKVTIDGEFFSAFKGSNAFDEINKGQFKEGDSVKIEYEAKGKYKNLRSIEKSSEPEPKKASEEINSVGYWQKKFDFDVERAQSTQNSIHKQSALKAALHLCEINKDEIPGEIPASSVIKIAKEFQSKYLEEDSK